MVRILETGLHIPNVDADFCSKVLGGIRISKIHIIRFVMNNRSIGFHGLTHIQYRFYYFIINLDQLDRFFSDLRCFRSDKSHTISDKSDFFVQRETVQRSWNRIGLTSRRISHPWDIFVSQNSSNTGQFFCLGSVDILD